MCGRHFSKTLYLQMFHSSYSTLQQKIFMSYFKPTQTQRNEEQSNLKTGNRSPNTHIY